MGAHGVDGHHGSRHVEQAQQLGDGLNPVALLSHRDLSEPEPEPVSKSTDHVQGALAVRVVKTAAQRLAIHGDVAGRMAL